MSTQLDENIPITMAKGTFRMIFYLPAGSYAMVAGKLRAAQIKRLLFFTGQRPVGGLCDRTGREIFSAEYKQFIAAAKQRPVSP